MKTTKLYLHNLLGEHHLQFFRLFKQQVEETGAETLKIAPQFAAWLLLFLVEEGAFKKIPKSAFTEMLQSADGTRDTTFRGMSDANLSGTRHFNPAIAEAAKRIQIVLDTYGNLAAKPQNAETAAINNLLLELRSDKYAADVETVGLTDWLDELDKNNQAYNAIDNERYDESAQRNTTVMREARAAVDAAYRDIIARIEAIYLLENSEVHKEFITRLNAIVEKYK
jgi:hypothetical protein